MQAAIHPDKKKFRELMLYIAQKSEGDPLFGATKLNKILFYSDFYAYLVRGKPITGVRYQHLDQGPAPRMLLPAKNELITAHRAAEGTRLTPRGVQKRLVCLESPNLSGFLAEEIALVDQVIEWLRDKSAEEVSALSHLEAGWKLTDLKEDIPYETAILDLQKPTPADYEWARSKAFASAR